MKLNIGLFNDSFPPTIDGVANCVKNYADIINSSFGKATVITPEYPYVIDDYPYEVYRYSSLKFKGKMPYRVGNPFSPKTVLELKRKDFDILHVHCPFASAVLAKEVSNKVTPTVFTYHTKFDIDIDNVVPNRQLSKIPKKFILNNINNADEVWTVTDGAIESLRTLGYKKDVIVMPNGIDLPKGKADADIIAEIKRIYKIDDTVPTFLFCGRMMWYKNIKLILDGLSLLKKDGIRFKAFFVGAGPDRPAIEFYSKQIALNDDYVVFVGPVYDREKLRGYYSLANLLLFPSTYDTSGLVVKEAAASSCASLLVKNSCASQNVIDFENGLLIEENPESFAKAIGTALKEPKFLEKIGNCAADTLYMSWQESIEKAYKRYEIVLENKLRKSK